jgi:hypothetical protein
VTPVQAQVGRRFALVVTTVGFAAITALALLDLLSEVSIVGGLMIGVFFAALAAPPRWVVLLGLYSLAWVVVLGFNGIYWGPGHWLRICLNITGTVVAVAATVSRDRRIEALTRTTNVAEVVQRALVHPVTGPYEGLDLAVRYVSSADGALVGGDVYGAERTPWGVRLMVADVCGHGLPAVDAAATLAFAFREAAHHRPSLDGVVAVMDESFRRRTTSPDFATCVVVQVGGRGVEVVNCGHPDPLVIDHTGTHPVVSVRRSAPLGLDPTPETHTVELATGSTLLLYTDGLIEARDRRGRFFDLEPNAIEAFRAGATADEALDRLLAAVRAHAGVTLRDDVVMLAARRTGC